jgi:sugar (pentulose or hexulose) kinase
MRKEIVVGVDSSTTATKAIAWDYSGNIIGIGSSPIPLSSPRPNYYEQDANDWWLSLLEALHKLIPLIDKEKIDAISITNQRETFVGLDAMGNPVRPAIIWLDERCKEVVDGFATEIGEDRIHQITGKPKDYAPVVYRLAWMKANENDLYSKTEKFCDVQTYLVNKLTRNFHTSWASADPLGLFDLEKQEWSSEILEKLNITPQHLPAAFRPGTVIGYVSKQAARLSGLIEGTKIVASGGDGQAAGLGVNALVPGRAYLNLGTAVVSGVYSKKYITDKSFRTMGSCSEEGYYCETSLRAGTFLVDWFIKQVLQITTSGNQEIYKQLEEEATQIEVGSHGLFVLPYWNAVMNPYWDPSAKGCIVGLTSAHNRSYIYRAILEGIAMEQSLATMAVENATGDCVKEYAVIGGGAKSELWCKILADATGKTILRMDAEEASSLGAGISAAVAAGWYGSFEEAAMNMVHTRSSVHPDLKNSEKYTELLKTYKQIYPAFKKIKNHNKA